MQMDSPLVKQLDAIFTTQGHSGQLPEEQKVLKDATKGTKRFCEIGFNAGHSAALVLSSDPKVEVVSFSLDEPFTQEGKKLIDKNFPGRHKLILGNSVHTVRKQPPLLCDTFFIDGGHEYKVAKADIENARKHLRPKGVLIMDDVNCDAHWCEGPSRSWSEAKADGVVADYYNWTHARGRRGFSVARYMK
tara:strand:+ start:1818 stop:2387 length:570 start_codon:yes stop_codon:yes gene_type:complete